ncbi:GAS2-like protein 2A isoform X2 [Bolinopsis microptera]|uniref:GAS2-like protein 2A isoform X2 n=1 Tax=Bolinopsis microptera TaxID=2820187 RepID=UPI003079F393
MADGKPERRGSLLGIPPPEPPIPERGPPLTSSIELRYIPLCVDLCHWINDYTGVSMEVNQFWTLLQDGCILCDLMNKIQQQHCVNIEETYQYVGYTLKRDLGDQLFYVRLNVETFIRWAKNFGCDKELLCQVGHLVERKDLERALSCVHAVARRVAELRMPYPKCVKLEVKFNMSYNDIVDLFDEHHSSLNEDQIHVKKCYADLCEQLGLGKMDITKPLKSNSSEWKSRLSDLWIGERPLTNGNIEPIPE